jgi:tetratricopeptide (TPR) repeat protein
VLFRSEELIKLKDRRGTKDLAQEINQRVKEGNKQAIELARAKKYKTALELLQHCEQCSNNINEQQLKASLKVLIYNSMSLIYKELDKYKLSLKCLERAVVYLKVIGDREGLIRCYLNISSTLSVLYNYSSAKVYAESAVAEAQKLVLELDVTNEEYTSRKTILGLAYFNVGLQEEHLKDDRKAYENYIKAKKLTEDDTSKELKMKVKNKLNYYATNKSLQPENILLYTLSLVRTPVILIGFMLHYHRIQ